MDTRIPPVTLAKWYCLTDDSHIQLLINPTLPQWRVVGAPEYVSVATRFVVTSSDTTWPTPLEEPTCCGLCLARQGGPVEVREGALLNFDNLAFARLTNMGRPYWRQVTSPPDKVGFYSGRLNYLLSYCQLEFVAAQDLTTNDMAASLLLQPTDIDFD
ncbi:hypothetical protein [Hymenobacter terrestris]|uniref:Uncharacterized protein n=1 Tax=Hymenobacter terrestris TaxID=2748310 RepID=A0ABX2Q245_9BACT|nr:hypothetical protein [Hymenobacter terrestris]NVO84491.1 hypothetical protein [Hymenobacter terrestris]